MRRKELANVMFGYFSFTSKSSELFLLFFFGLEEELKAMVKAITCVKHYESALRMIKHHVGVMQCMIIIITIKVISLEKE